MNNERLNYNIRAKLSNIVHNPLASREVRKQAEEYYYGTGACDLETIKEFAEKYGLSRPSTLNYWEKRR